jgi:hypothetical protein
MTLEWLEEDTTIALHRDAKGSALRMPISKGIVQLIDKYVKPGDATLETGAGLSTVAFIAKGARHTAIAPDEALGTRIREFCHSRDLEVDNLSYYPDHSQDILHTIACEYSFCLIDGSHSFPEVFVDFFFINPLLKVGGVLIVDDTWIWTGEILVKFLAADPKWRLVYQDFKSAAFKKITKTYKYNHFENQRFVISNSNNLALNHE